MRSDRLSFLRRLGALADTPWLLAALAALVLCYPLGAAFVWLATAALALLCCVGSPAAMTTGYVFLFLYDNMLPFPFLGGSLVRVLQAGILLRAAAVSVKRRALPDRFTLAALPLIAATCGISFFLKGLTGDSLSFAISMLVLLALRNLLRPLCRATDEPAAAMAGNLRRWMRAYVAAAVTAVVFGVAFNRFYVLGEGGPVRFLGTHEPNFMAMFLDVALVLWLMLPRPATRFPRLLDAAVLGALLGGLAMTGSITGLAIAGCMALACCWRICRARSREVRRGALGALCLRLLCGGMIAAVVTAGGVQLARVRPQKERDIYAIRASTGLAAAETPAFIAEEEYRALRAAGEPVAPHLLTAAQWQAYREEHGIHPVEPRLEEDEPLMRDALARAIRRVPVLGGRLYTALGYARKYGLDVATSGRWGLIAEKLRDFGALPIWQKLLGRGPDPETTYFPMFQTFGYSHNSYLDLLTGFGAAGLAALLWWFAHAVRRGRFFGFAVGAAESAPEDASVRAALSLARIALLLHAATLSMHLNRVFLFFFIG